jgi:hypothetical protein
MGGATLLAGQNPGRQTLQSRLPRGVPPGVAAIIGRTLKEYPASLNTDWFGTLLMKGMLEWAERGFPETRQFATRWLDFHLSSGRLSPYSGPKTRTVSAGGIFITTYCGHFGLAFPCYEMARQLRDERARQVCVDIGKIILHQTRRNQLGMVADNDHADFSIPDDCYFVVAPLMIAAALDREQGPAFQAQAVYQLRAFIDVFLNKETGLARTILEKDTLGKTYWTRASGWLLWAITGVLRFLPPQDPNFPGVARDLNTLAGGMARVQDSGGGLHLFLNEPGSPLETTGTAMCAMGLHEAIRKGWIPRSYRSAVECAWSFVEDHITPEGDIRQAYTGWAVPAEQGIVEMDKHAMGWIPGFVLSTANELATPLQ